MIRRPPRPTRTYTLFPYTTLFRSLPASGRSCLGPGDGHGTVSFRLSDESVRLWPHRCVVTGALASACRRSEEHTSELQSLMRISYAVFCLKKKKQSIMNKTQTSTNSNIYNTVTNILRNTL